MEQKGVIVSIRTTMSIESFKAMDVILSIPVEKESKLIENYGRFRLIQKNCELINPFQVGDNVIVSFNIEGTQFQHKITKETLYSTNLMVYKIEKIII